MRCSRWPESFPSDLLEIIRERPTVVAELLRAVRAMPAKKVSAISRQMRAGDW